MADTCQILYIHQLWTVIQQVHKLVLVQFDKPKQVTSVLRYEKENEDDSERSLLTFVAVLTFCDLLFPTSLPSFFQSVKIRLGVYQPSIRNKKEQIRNYSLIIPAPEFKAQSLENDLMLMKLSKPAVLNSHVGTIAISMEPLTFNDSCFIPTWTWNEYKNCKCLTL